MSDILIVAFLFLTAGVLAVPLATRLGLGSVLGSLIAGIALAPLLALCQVDVVAIHHFAELGVVMMLFLVGLELEPRLLWHMRSRLVGLGGTQVVITAAFVAAGAVALGLDWRMALAIGLILAMSSTAIALQTFNEKGLMKGDGGQTSFSVLLFQDIAVIPILALMPLLAMPGFALLPGEFLPILGLTPAMMAAKAAVLLLLARLFRLRGAQGWLMALGLAQTGEFGCVLIAFALSNGVLPQSLAPRLTLMVTLSMILTPALFILWDRVICPRLERIPDREADRIDEPAHILIAGQGRFGGIVNRTLLAAGHETTVLDHSAEQLEALRAFGIRVYYGNATRPDLLHAAGIDKAHMLVVAIDEPDRATALVEYVHKNHPDVHIVAHAREIMTAQAEQLRHRHGAFRERSDRGWTLPSAEAREASEAKAD